MSVQIQTINVIFRTQSTESFEIKFFPALKGFDGEIVLQKVYAFTVQTDGTIDDTADTKIHLPAPSGGVYLRYDYEFPSDVSILSKGYFYLTFVGGEDGVELAAVLNQITEP